MRIVFFGSADFGLPALERLLGAGHELVGLVSTTDSCRGRGLALQPSAVAAWARRHGTGPVLKPEQLDAQELAGQLTQWGADLFIVIAYRILPERLFTIPPLGTINVHASLLPRLRGPAPIQRAIEYGETRTGVTVFLIDGGVDTGGVLLQRDTAIGAAETAPQLYERLSVLGAEALLEALDGLQSGALKPRPQDNALSSRAPKLRKEEGRIDWSLPSECIERKVRAFQPFPATYTMRDGKRLGVLRVALAPGEALRGVAGTVLALDADGMVVATGSGPLRVIKVKPEGKGEMDAAAYARGARLAKGAVLG